MWGQISRVGVERKKVNGNGRWRERVSGEMRLKGETEEKRGVKIVYCSDVTSGRSPSSVMAASY